MQKVSTRRTNLTKNKEVIGGSGEESGTRWKTERKEQKGRILTDRQSNKQTGRKDQEQQLGTIQVLHQQVFLNDVIFEQKYHRSLALYEYNRKKISFINQI